MDEQESRQLAATVERLHRSMARVDVDLARVLDHFGLAPVADEEVDEVLRAQS